MTIEGGQKDALPRWANIKKGDFDNQLECAAPKRWSKYTTLAGHISKLK